MRVPQALRTGQLGLNMTPMIDVIFLLIIFFLVSSHLARQEAHMQLPLPVADSGTAPHDSATRRLTLNVLRDGTLRLAGRRIEPDELKQRLAEVSASEGEDIEVRVRSDREVPYREVQPIMVACARAGIWNVTFGVYRPEDAP